MKAIKSDPKTAKKQPYQFTGLERVGSLATLTQTGTTVVNPDSTAPSS